MGDIPRDSYLRTRDRLTARRTKAQQELNALEPDKPGTVKGPADFRETVAGLLEEWDTISVSAKRLLLSEVALRVEIYPGDRVEVVPTWARSVAAKPTTA
jgi:hypothetical protein